MSAALSSVTTQIGDRCHDLLLTTQKLNVCDRRLKGEHLLFSLGFTVRNRLEASIGLEQELDSEISALILAITKDVELMTDEPPSDSHKCWHQVFQCFSANHGEL
ncbi:MAG: hypothetical protein U0002_08410 [Thermoanaerobaculia bacterium]